MQRTIYNFVPFKCRIPVVFDKCYLEYQVRLKKYNPSKKLDFQSKVLMLLWLLLKSFSEEKSLSELYILDVGFSEILDNTKLELDACECHLTFLHMLWIWTRRHSETSTADSKLLASSQKYMQCFKIIRQKVSTNSTF